MNIHLLYVCNIFFVCGKYEYRPATFAIVFLNESANVTFVFFGGGRIRPGLLISPPPTALPIKRNCCHYRAHKNQLQYSTHTPVPADITVIQDGPDPVRPPHLRPLPHRPNGPGNTQGPARGSIGILLKFPIKNRWKIILKYIFYSYVFQIKLIDFQTEDHLKPDFVKVFLPKK